jgi:glycosyltransferase involved in cell wall biosynthesis
MLNNKILIIGLIWPEPNATAAGSRMIQLIHFFIKQGYKVSFASAASASDLSFDFSALPVSCFNIELNSASFDEDLKNLDPGMVVFDRFLTEEQYSWRVQQTCPDAIRILDTEDLHFLRKAREIAVKKGVDQWMEFIQNDTTKREVASIFRSDLSLIISQFESKLLQEAFKIDTSLLFYLPFLIDAPQEKDLAELPGFGQRQDFMTIGNFRHQPNLDAVKYLHSHIWPMIRKELPQAKLNIYGAYAPEAIKQLHNPATGFLIKGWIADKKEAFINSRICLAPLRFGAGQKGKLLDSMMYGTPSITSTIGAEGMLNKSKWNGFIENETAHFAAKAVQLHQDKTLWVKSQKNGYALLRENYDKKTYESSLAERLESLDKDLDKHRKANFIGTMLSHHLHQSTKFLSKWIETKNLLNDKIIE